MFNQDIKKYKNALLIGTGGGNDIVSAIIPALELQSQGLKTDVAGILSPGAIHTYDGIPEKPINKIEGTVKRYIASPKTREISFIDANIPKLVSESGIDIENFYNFSTRFGTLRLIEEINKLTEEKEYDIVIGVDVGGDILGRGKEDPFLLSPVMDFTTLNILGNISVPSYLIEFGLGTDGELRPDSIDAIIDELQKDKTIIHKSIIKKNDKEINSFRNLFDKVKNIRPGHTAVMTLETLENNDDIISEYRYKMRVGDSQFSHSFEILLPKKYSGKTYLMMQKNYMIKEKLLHSITKIL